MRNLGRFAFPLLVLLASCGHELDGPAPQVTSTTPALVCSEQLTTEVVLAGAGLSPLAVDALTGDPKLALPTITLERTADLAGSPTTDPPVVLNPDATDVANTGVRWVNDTSMAFDVHPGLGLAPGTYRITVTNGNGKSFSADEVLGAIPAPEILSVEPDLICTAEGTNTLTLTGTNFLRAGQALPTVTIGGQTYPVDALSACADAPGPEAGAEVCGTATVTVPQGDLAEGVHSVSLLNPAPAACSSDDPATPEVEGPTIAVVPPPTVESVEPDLVCVAEGENVLTITGTGFITVGGLLPTVTIGGTAFGADGVSGCTSISGTLSGAESCTTLTVTIPMDGVAEGAQPVVVENPPPAGCSSTSAVTIAVVPPPVVTDLAPNPVCNEQGASSIDVTGSGFLDVDGVLPTVAIDGAPAAVIGVAGCVPVEGTTLAAQTCTSITIAVPGGTLAAGDHDVTVQNPPPAACSTAAPVTLTVVPPPDVTGVIPSVTCTGGGDFVVVGTGFSSTPSVTVGGVPATVTAASPTSISATLGAGLTPGVYDVVVSNGDGCSDTLPAAVTITPGPAVFFVDPPVVYNGVSLQATIYVSGIAAAPAAVSIRPAGGGALTALVHTFSPAYPNRIQAVVPAGLAAGDYDVVVDDGSCDAILPAGLHVTDTLTVAIEAIEPPFGWTSEDTAVTVTAVSPAPPGMVQFQATPRAYLNPDVPGPGTLATPLAAVAFVDAGRLTAVVPDGLPAGLYDLIVVNPDGSVGLLDAAFTVTPAAAPPPEIDAVSPASVINQPGQAVTVTGQDFRTPTVTATCQDDAGMTYVIDGTGVVLTGSTTIDVTFDMGALTNGGICVVRVTNDDGTYADYSALAVSNPAQNLPPTVADDSMVVARRGLAATAGRVTSQARHVYALGGDDGTDAGLLTSVETAPVDLYGELDPWFVLPAQSALPEGRSLATAVAIGRFIYLVGGRTAAGATASVLRAQILDPRAAPEITDLALDFGDGIGLEGGLFYYRVSAVMGPTDPSNPGGETLASDPLAVVVPPVPSLVRLTIFWTAVPGAAAYRIYRTPAPGGLVGDVALIATVTAPATSYVDEGAAAGADGPLPTGALGVWHEVGPMPSAREGAGVTFARDPDGANGFFLYAVGGRSGPATATGSYTYAEIVVAPDGSQAVGSFSADTPFLAVARWQLGAVALDHDRASVVPAVDTWIYAMGGWNAAATMLARDVTAAKVAADGSLTGIVEVDDMVPGQAGYGFAGANNFLFAFGGGGGGPGTGTFSAKLCTPGQVTCAGGAPEPPDLVNWNALGFALVEARYLAGSALESAFIFLCGGQSDSAAATATTERTHW